MDIMQTEALDQVHEGCEDGHSRLSSGGEESSSIAHTTTIDQDRLMELAKELFRGTVPRALDFEILLLKRKEDTLHLHQRFSTNAAEKESQVLDRISAARKEARQVAAYTCISEYMFAEPRIDRHFCYQRVVSEARLRKQPLKLVDVGCCVGTDIRQLIHDGFPPGDITGIDIEKRFFTIGFALYNQNRTDSPTTFVQANILDPDFTRRFSHLKGKFDYVHSANVIHLFDYASQVAFLRALAFLAKPGGLVWGRQVTETEDSPTRSVKLEGKGERFTPVEFMRMWTTATGFQGPGIEWTSRI
ncbi:uncharacterized protein Triagg1_9396 [Trichoderma aggressivum f. europaeum]|uniref:Methyltransferase type 12 domain-containing protein n=1 Tax=Trichoderma aggressivum f. europaeum TaxID=173218 RepID=A0AAE1I8X7_9HYPO|nr:hypothetical protein Triagg1_9396 [Trichoderma aggressivum f. europaeum]